MWYERPVVSCVERVETATRPGTYATEPRGKRRWRHLYNYQRPVCRSSTWLMCGSANATIEWLGRKNFFSIVFVCLERGNSWRIAKFAPRYGARHARTRHPSLSFPQGYLQVILWWNRKNPQTKNKGMIEMPTRDVRQQDMTSQPVWQVCKQQLPLGAAPSGNVRLQFRLSNFPFILSLFFYGRE